MRIPINISTPAENTPMEAPLAPFDQKSPQTFRSLIQSLLTITDNIIFELRFGV